MNEANKERRSHPPSVWALNSMRASWRVAQRRRRRAEGAAERGPYVLTSAKPGSVRREPFARWLESKLETMTYTELSQATGVAERLLRSYVRGFDHAGKYLGSNRKGRNGTARKYRAVDWVEIGTVDRAFTSMGEAWLLDDLYPIPDDIGDDS